MEKYCKFCGEPLNEEGKCPNGHEFKKMCLNCIYCTEEVTDGEDGHLFCMNAENKKNALNKMLELLNKEGNGYAVKTLEIEPVPLKRPTLKCGSWELDETLVREILGFFK